MTSRRDSLPPPKPETWPPPQHSTDAAMRMIPLFERGQAALAAYVDSLPLYAQPTGGADATKYMKVVTAADFDANAPLIRKHVCLNTCVVHVLCEDGHLCALVEPRVIRHWGTTP